MAGGVRRFEDLIAWQKAFQLAQDVHRLVRADAGDGRVLAEAIQRTSTAIMARIAEGFEFPRARDFREALTAARAICAELRSQLYLAKAIGLVNEDDAEMLLAEAEEVGRIIGSLRRAIAQHRDPRRRGPRRGPQRGRRDQGRRRDEREYDEDEGDVDEDEDHDDEEYDDEEYEDEDEDQPDRVRTAFD